MFDKIPYRNGEFMRDQVREAWKQSPGITTLLQALAREYEFLLTAYNDLVSEYNKMIVGDPGDSSQRP